MQRRKGDPTDITFLLIILFFLAVTIVVALFVNGKISEIISGTVLNSTSAYESINDSFTTINQFTVQRAFTIMFGLLIIAILASSFLIRVHPVFLFIYIFTLGVAIFTSVYLANAYEALVSNPAFASFASNYATITWIMQHVATILLGAGVISMIIIFGKIGQTQGGADI